MSFEEKVRALWKDTPAVITVKEIKRRNQLPRWEKCPKDHLYVGIVRRKKSDRLIVVKHQMEMQIDCAPGYTVEMLSDKELYYAGIIPCHNPMVCKKCGEFSTRINIGHICTDCLNKKKAVG